MRPDAPETAENKISKKVPSASALRLWKEPSSSLMASSWTPHTKAKKSAEKQQKSSCFSAAEKRSLVAGAFYNFLLFGVVKGSGESTKK
jgi:hypothetical protein